jgi:hypothetical protein
MRKRRALVERKKEEGRRKTLLNLIVKKENLGASWMDEIQLADYVRFFCEFFSAKEDIYTEKVEDMISKNETRLMVNLNDLRDYNPEKTIE